MYSLYYIVQCFEIMLIKQLSISYCSNFFYNCQGVVAKQVILCKEGHSYNCQKVIVNTSQKLRLTVKKS